MFGKKNIYAALASPAEVDAYQAANDPKTIAAGIISGSLVELQLAQVHPWDASDITLMRMGTAAIAYANDRLAEIICEDTAVSTPDGDKMPPSAAQFATTLSQNAARQASYSQTLYDNSLTRNVVENGSLFDEAVRTKINPENMLPYWPVGPLGKTADWQSFEAGEVTGSFIRAIIRAGNELQADTLVGLEDIKSKACTVVPPKMALLREVIDESCLKRAELDLRSAHDFMSASSVPPASMVQTAYEKAHDGYVLTMLANTAIVCPPVLGIDYLPER